MATESTVTDGIDQAAEDAAAEAAFAKGFLGGADAAEKTVTAPVEAPTITDPPPAAPTPPAPVDPMASLPEEVRNALSAIPVMQREFSELRRTAGQIPQIQSSLDKIAKSIPAPVPPAPPAPPREKLDKLRGPDGLPEVADAIEEQVAHLKSTMAPPPAAPTPPPDTAADEDEQNRRMDAAVPEWRQIGGSKGFRDWAGKQADGQTILTTDDPLVFAFAIGKYKAAQSASANPQAAAVNATRQARATAAVVPTSTARPTAPATETLEDAFAKGFNKGRARASQ